MSFADDLLNDGDADVREIPDGLDVAALVRHAASESTHGLAWRLHLELGATDASSLLFGLRDGRGFLSWFDGLQTTTSLGENAEPVDYWNGGRHLQIEPRTELDEGHVFAGLGEFIATYDRPRCIRWSDQDPIWRHIPYDPLGRNSGA